MVITGASKGLGYALAREHLAAGDRLVICARDGARLAAAAAALQREFPSGEVHAMPCDVSNGYGASPTAAPPNMAPAALTCPVVCVDCCHRSGLRVDALMRQ